MSTTCLLFQKSWEIIQGMGNGQKAVHALLWGGGLIWFNLPIFSYTIGLFHSNDYSLLLPSLYGVFLNALIFYGNVWLLEQFFKKERKTFWLYSLLMLIQISLVEGLLDSGFYGLFYGQISTGEFGEIMQGSLLMNGMFFYLPSFCWGILRLWQKEGEDDDMRKISIRDGRKEVYFWPNELLFVEAKGNYASYQTHKQKYLIRKSLAEIEKELPRQFVRCHRSYIVNVELIHTKSYNQLDVAGRKIPIGRKYKGQLDLG